MSKDITTARMELYDDLNEAGRAFVDDIAAQLEAGIMKRNKKAHIGAGGSRELAVAILQTCWAPDGDDGIIQALTAVQSQL